jgi:hypothetical protein
MPVPATKPATLPARPEGRYDEWYVLDMHYTPIGGDRSTTGTRVRAHLWRSRKLPDGTDELMPERGDGSHHVQLTIPNLQEACKTNASLKRVFGDTLAVLLALGVGQGKL